jgi:D-alanyl-D-alanine dipeptidase
LPSQQFDPPSMRAAAAARQLLEQAVQEGGSPPGRTFGCEWWHQAACG